MKRHAINLAVFVLAWSAVSAGSPVRGSDLQKSLKSRWLGAWVVTHVEAYSDCGPSYTNNRVNGTLVKSSGRRGFDSGELAKLEKVDLRRSRLDLHIALAEPLLLDYQEGPFTLYREARCRIEMQLELPRGIVKSKDIGAVEAALTAILERHTTEGSARASRAWNAREIEEYPADYEQTLAEHRHWQATRTNAAVEAQLERAYAATRELAHRLNSDAEYAAAFAEGVEDAQGDDLTRCPRLLAVDLTSFKREAAKAAADDPASATVLRGFQDGRQLVYGLELIARLPDCFVALPELASDDD